MTVKIRDLIAAEEALEAAEAEYRRLTTDFDNWSAYESLDKRGKRTLNVMPAQFERQESAQQNIRAARLQLIATKRAFLEGVIDDAEL
jgi:hypothetical protein